MHEKDTIVCNLEFLTGFKKKKQKDFKGLLKL